MPVGDALVSVADGPTLAPRLSARSAAREAFKASPASIDIKQLM